MNVLIVDDNTIDANRLYKLLYNFFYLNHIECKVHIVNNVNDIKLGNEYDLIFLDIEINNSNGICVAKELRKFNKNTRIIIVSNYEKYALEGYKVQANRYFLKPVNPVEFNAEMSDVLKQYILQNKYFMDNKLCNHKIYYRDILYIETLQRHSYIYLSNDDPIISLYPLKYWTEIFKDAYFAQSHKSFIVNLQNVSSFNSNEINLINNKKLPLSRKYKESFLKQYQLFLDVLV